MIFLKLFYTFFLIGLFGFGGGYGMLSLIQTETVVHHHWLSSAEFTNIVAISQMTPGPIGLNCATFAGMRVAGILGSMISVLGVLMPTFTICAVAAVFFQKFKDSRILKTIMVGVRPAALGIIIAVMISLSRTNYLVAGTVSMKAAAVGLIAFFLLTKGKWSVPKVIVLSAFLGLLI